MEQGEVNQGGSPYSVRSLDILSRMNQTEPGKKLKLRQETGRARGYGVKLYHAIAMGFLWA